MDIFLSIAGNGALLLSLSFLYSLFIPYLQHSQHWVSAIITGVLFGGFALLNMFEPMRFGNGVIVDPRNVILMVAAAVSGFRAGFGAFIVVASYRIYLGGDAMWSGLASMLTAVILGLLYQRHRKTGQSIRLDRKMILMGILVAVESLLWTLTLPNGYGWTLLPSITLPVLIIYPLVTYSLVWLIASAYQRLELTIALEESEGRFRAIFEQTVQLLCLMDADGTIRSVSPSLLKSARLNQAQLIGSKFWDVDWNYMPETTINEIKTQILGARTGQNSHTTIDLSMPKSQTILDITFQRIRETGQILMEAHDITEQIVGEKRRLELQFERERNDILSQLIGDASHHLRTPLAIISTSLYLLRKQTDSTDTSPEWHEKMNASFNRLGAAWKDLVDIVEDLLSMMRLDNPAAQRFEPYEFAGYSREILEAYYAIADEKKINLTCENCELVLPVSIVPGSFRRVIANLIENALRYTLAGGSVTVSIKQQGDMAEFAVQDTGIGIHGDDLPRIFDRFFRARNASSQSLKGTGLGLAIVKKTVDMHKGQIEIKSEEGRGTRVAILIPLVRESVGAAN